MTHPPDSSTAPPVETVLTEDELAQRLGVARSVLRDVRGQILQVSVHWILQKVGVSYTAAGVDAVCRHLHVSLGKNGREKNAAPAEGGDKAEGAASVLAAETAPEKNGADPTAPTAASASASAETVAVIVTRRAIRNRHVVFAHEKNGAPAEGERPRELAVRVRDADMVGIGDELHVRVQGGLATLYGPQPRPARRRMARRPAMQPTPQP